MFAVALFSAVLPLVIVACVIVALTCAYVPNFDPAQTEHDQYMATLAADAWLAELCEATAIAPVYGRDLVAFYGPAMARCGLPVERRHGRWVARPELFTRMVRWTLTHVQADA